MRRLFFWIILPVFGLALISILSLFLLCAFKGELMASVLENQLRSLTGLPWQVKGTVVPKLYPYPGVKLQDVRVLAASEEQELLVGSRPPLLEVNEVHVLVDFKALLGGRLRLHLVELDSPKITFAFDRDGIPLWLPLPPEEELQEDQESVWNDVLEIGEEYAAGINRPSPTVGDISGAQAEVVVPEHRELRGEQTRYALETLNAFLSSGEYIALPLLRVVNATFVHLNEKGEIQYSLREVSLEFTPESPDSLIRYQAAFSMPSAGLEVQASGTLAWTRAFALEGHLNGSLTLTPPESLPVKGFISSSVSWIGGEPEVNLPDLHLEAEGDVLLADLTLQLVREYYAARVQVENFSLPRWFKFARELPPGLQVPLHTITGSLDAYGTTDMVEARNLRLYAGGLEIRGGLGCPDYSDPTVRVRLFIESANLDLIFPFLTAPGVVVPEPEEIEFSLPYFVPYPGLGEDEGPDVGYDVTIRVNKPLVHSLEGGPLLVKVFPLEGDVTRVSFEEKNILGGSLDGYLDIDKRLVKMHFVLGKVGLKDLPENQGNSVVVDGKVSGTCDIAVLVDENKHWAKDWTMTIDGVFENLKITGGPAKDRWWLLAGMATARGSGPVHTIRADGIKVSGDWDIEMKQISSSWYPGGTDALTADFKGALLWPPMEDGAVYEQTGVRQVQGQVAATGVLTVPLGSERVPLKGSLQGEVDWNLYQDTMTLDQMAFDGLDSFVGGKIDIDASGAGVEVIAPVNFKLSPRVLLEAWDLLPAAVAMPATLTGTTEVRSKGDTVTFGTIKAEADGDPLEGVAVVSPGEGGKGAHWRIRLTSSRLNLDNFFPAATEEERSRPPSTVPWNLSFLNDLSIDAELLATAAKFHNLNFTNTKVTAALQRGRFSLQAATNDLYGGVSTILAQGTVVPERSEVSLTSFLGEMHGVSLSRALQDLSGENAYSGSMDMIFDLKGLMHNDAEKYSGLDGIWSMTIVDGAYPAFIGSETAGLRNTFTRASASGPVERGVIRSDNFILSGLMVDMKGGGWVDLGRRNLEIEVEITLARVPTVPVRLYGSFDKLQTSVRGALAVTSTAAAAGNTIFGLVMGILELPGRAIMGVGDLLSD